MKLTGKQVNLIVRVITGAILFIVGITYANTGYFREYPLFGVPFLAEFAIALVLGLTGYYLIPDYFVRIKQWLEDLIIDTTYNLFVDLWNQYTTRMEQSRKQRKIDQQKKNKKDMREVIGGGVLVDTSILIDGRIVDIAKTGFIPGKLIVPKYVINELHTLSDSSDKLKREKGRRGLDILTELRKCTKVVIFGNKSTHEGVDRALITLAKEHSLRIMTLDFNLNKVAGVSNIQVLNIHKLSEAIKPDFIPGEKLNIKIIHEGKEKEQGVGYLPDGTMIVVANAKPLLNQSVDVEVTKLIQSPAGKIVFSELATN